MSNYNRAINLRPWREELKEKQQKEFTQISLLVVLLALLISLLMWNNLTSSLENIKAENSIVTDKITSLKKELREVVDLKEKRQVLIDNLKIIQNLQNDRDLTNAIYIQLASSVNDGVFFTAVERNANRINVSGSANPTQAVSELMRSLGNQPNFTSPELTSLTTQEDTGLTLFNLTFTLKGVR